MRAPAEAQFVRAAFAAGLLLAGCGGSSKADVSTTSMSVPVPSPAVSEPAVPTGYTAAVVQVTRADGTTESYCVWLATTEAERERGLMGVTSLGGADGMLFRFGTEQSGMFWMKDTVLPLSIAFFGGDGAFVSATDMEPCPPDVAACPTYAAAAPYADALEVVKGGLAPLGIAAGSRLVVTDAACSPD
jgi:uncharacterized membrane protein (UPF0127 family)